MQPIPPRVSALAKQVERQAEIEHDAQFGQMARQLAFANRLIRAQHQYIAQLEARVAELDPPAEPDRVRSIRGRPDDAPEGVTDAV